MTEPPRERGADAAAGDEARELQRRAVGAAVAGDAGELGTLLEAYRPRLQRMVAFRMDPRLSGRVEAGDVVQEAFAEILQRLRSWLERDMDLFLWARLQTGQKLQQIHRRNLEVEARDARREVPLELRGVPGASSFAMASALLDGSNTPSRVAMKQEEGLRLRDALDELKEVDREVIAMRHFEMLSNKEVAQVLELSEPGATLRYVRAVMRLKARLDELGIVTGALPTLPA